MNPKVKLVLYVLLAGAFAFCGWKFFQASRDTDAGGSPVPGTNVAGAGTQALVLTNIVSTNAASSNAVAVIGTGDDGTARRASGRVGRMMAYGVAAFFALVGLSVMIGYDVSRFFANRVEDFIFNDDLKGVKDPEYEEAENIWAKGDYLDAVQLMRDYYKRHPSEVYVALRIAEIYETNLHNYLAAALEYEEVLKRRLPAERWGWAAIHLANLYSGKLNKPTEAAELLHRIANEYGQTAAAKKARERLGLPEPMLADVIEAAAEPQAAATPVVAAPADKPASNLPPGFRPK